MLNIWIRTSKKAKAMTRRLYTTGHLRPHMFSRHNVSYVIFYAYLISCVLGVERLYPSSKSCSVLLLDVWVLTWMDHVPFL